MRRPTSSIRSRVVPLLINARPNALPLLGSDIPSPRVENNPGYSSRPVVSPSGTTYAATRLSRAAALGRLLGPAGHSTRCSTAPTVLGFGKSVGNHRTGGLPETVGGT